MKGTLAAWWVELKSGFWFIPTLLVLGAVVLGLALIEADLRLDSDALDRWPLLFGVGAEGARGVLTAIASSMITVAGVVFSITIVALSLAASQYSPRVLRNFMRDRMNQTVLGLFLGVFAYCLVVLRTIRGADEGSFVPSLAVLGAFVLAFIGIGFLVYFFHHIALSIQASQIIAVSAEETLAAVDRLFPDELGEGVDKRADWASAELDFSAAVPAARSGYLVTVDGEGLLRFAEARKCVLRLEYVVGEFVIERSPLLVTQSSLGLDEDSVHRLRQLFVINRHRSIEQDAPFGIRQIVDIGLKALSTGINDPTTAVMAIDYLQAILVRLAGRSIATPFRGDDGKLRVMAPGPTFADLVAQAMQPLIASCGGNAEVLAALLRTLGRVEPATVNAGRRRVLAETLAEITEMIETSVTGHRTRGELLDEATRLARVLDAPRRE